MRKLIAAAALAATAGLVTVTGALACGGLVAPDGDVRLDKATTFVAWHGGVERYITSFAYSGAAADVGWIVPLPTVPSSITSAGRWTLQRLEREFAPPLDEACSLEPVDVRGNGRCRHAFERCEVGDADAGVVVDRGEDRNLPGGHPQVMHLPAQMPVEVEQHRPEAVRHRHGVGVHRRSHHGNYIA